MTLRLTSSSLAGTLRKLVAVGTSRLASMLRTIAAPAPRIGLPGVVGGRRRLRLGGGRGARGAALGGASVRAAARGVRPRHRPVGVCAAATRADCRRRRGRGGDRGRGCLVVGEELLPLVADRVGVADELLVHLLDEPRVRTEVGPCPPGLVLWRCHVRQGNQARPTCLGDEPQQSSPMPVPARRLPRALVDGRTLGRGARLSDVRAACAHHDASRLA